MKILYATPECAPYVKTGGLGDVSAALPAKLDLYQIGGFCPIKPDEADQDGLDLADLHAVLDVLARADGSMPPRRAPAPRSRCE